MASNVILFGWNQPARGREPLSAQHFQEFSQFLGGLQQGGKIQDFEVIFLDAHGGDLNGFFLIRGDNAQLDTLVASDEWQQHMTRAGLHLDGVGIIRGATGALVMERMQRWGSLLPG